MSEPKQIVNRETLDLFTAWEWANTATSLGWRVVAVVRDGTFWHVWAEAPAEAEPDLWDRTHKARRRP